MSRVVQFPLQRDAAEESSDQGLVENGDDRTAADMDSPDGIEFECRSGLDPSEWGVPRAFFVVAAPVERTVDSNTAS